MPKFQNHDFENEDYTKMKYTLSKSDPLFEAKESDIEKEITAWKELMKLTGREFPD